MRVLVNDHSGHAFPYELSGELASRGHDVHHVYCSNVVTPKTNFSNGQVTTHAIDADRPFAKYDLRRRALDELRYGWRSVKIARQVRPERLIVSNMPLLAVGVQWLWALTTRTKWVLWLQDLQAGLAQMVIGKRNAVTRTLSLVEGWLIRRAWRVVAISAEFRSEVLKVGAKPERVLVIENWAPLDDLPLRPRRNPWSDRHGLSDQFVFLYSGTLAMKHDPRLLLALADEFRNEAEVRIVVVSEGVGADWLSEANGVRTRSNLVLLPFQPFEELADVLGSADVLVAVLERAAGMFSVPSKTLSYLCAGRAILGSIPEQNAAASLIAERAPAGICVPPGDDAGELLAAARKLFENSALRQSFGTSARAYAETTFDRRAIGDRFEHLLTRGST